LAYLISHRRYENAFDKQLIEAICPGDCVWDVGANVGYYTVKIADRVGPTGCIFAFEPSPENLSKLSLATKAIEAVHIIPKALGEKNGTSRFLQGSDQLGATSRIAEDDVENAVDISMAAADDIVRSGEVVMPNVVKIDTEGYELEVLKGMMATLHNSSLRTVLVEVHFRLLSERGLSKAAADVEKILIKTGFCTHWTDSSHLVGNRRQEASPLAPNRL
jgi:FkbM family methyltransferase